MTIADFDNAIDAMIGHDAAWRAWHSARAGGRMHHGWILAGPEGLGKGTFARAAAADWVAEPGVPQPAWAAHPDIHLIEPLPNTDDDAKKRAEGKPFARKRNISIDQLRAMQRRLTTRPTLGNRRAVIIDPADAMEKSAVNALLKSLEEPPEGTLFLLVVHGLGRLLPTVRSRCLIVRFSPLDDAAMAQVLADAEGLSADEREGAIALAGGSPGAALAFAALRIGRVGGLLARLIDSGDADLSIRAGLAPALGARPDRDTLLAVIEASRRLLLGRLPDAPSAARLRMADAHDALLRLAAEVPTYNYDPGLLMAQIGGLLAGVGATREGG